MPANGDARGTCTFPTELGWMAIAWTSDCLERLTFGHPSASAAAAYLAAESSGGDSGSTRKPPEWVAAIIEQVQSYTAGESVSFADVPVELSHLTQFQRAVVRACRRIPWGEVRTYGELAKAAGGPGAARAVGSVMARNRFPIIVPCHRVIGSAGTIGGFSAPDGLDMKRRMLAIEGRLELKPRLVSRSRSRPSVAR